MNREKMKKAIMGSLIGALGLWFVVERLAPGTQPVVAAESAQSGIEAAEASDEAQPAAQNEVAGEEERRRWLAATWPANPFYKDRKNEPGANPKNEAADANARFILSAIIQGCRPQALIDGAYLTVGDRLPDGSRILTIESNSVVLQGPEGPWTLKLPE